MSSTPDRLPVACDLTLAYALSLIIGFIMAVVSVVGPLYPAEIYPADELLKTFVPNNVVILVIGVSILLGSI
jgi:hypothetical protein